MAVGESRAVTVPPDGSSVVTRTRSARTAAVCAAVCLVVLALLGAGVRTAFGPQLRLDAVVTDSLYAGDHRSAAVDWLLKVLTTPGSSWFRFVVFLPVLVLLLRRRAWWTALWAAVTIVGIGPLTTLLKDIFGRVRPAYARGGAQLDTLSFPSGHASGIATLVTAGLLLAWPLLSLRGRRWWVLAGVALVLVVGLTRIWLGVHYPSDVLGGWSLGIAWTLLTALLFGALPGGRAALGPRT
jgi:membrane-associated phospholipid phosphatase